MQQAAYPEGGGKNTGIAEIRIRSAAAVMASAYIIAMPKPKDEKAKSQEYKRV
jgi:hypothetical protein